jgi:uncharacterized membrane protein YdbT with pleckstrin-like domain
MDPIYQMFHLDFNERVIYKTRPHWFIFFKKIIIFLIEAIVPVIIYAVINNFFPELLIDQRVFALLFLGASLYYLFIWLILFYNWVDYYLDMFIITDKQIIDVAQRGIFNRRLAQYPLSRIQDVMVESKGIFPTMLHFGDLHIQTAGAQARTCFDNIPEPFLVADKINDLIKSQTTK